jgi:hypothetical protein
MPARPLSVLLSDPPRTAALPVERVISQGGARALRLPIVAGGSTLETMSAPREQGGSLTPAEQEDLVVALRRLLQVTGVSLQQRAHLENALESRIVVEQAKGMLAERLRLSLAEAFELLRGAARANRRRVHDLAREVIEQPETPAVLLAQLHKLLRSEKKD